jgi:hypothetical protein
MQAAAEMQRRMIALETGEKLDAASAGELLRSIMEEGSSTALAAVRMREPVRVDCC